MKAINLLYVICFVFSSSQAMSAVGHMRDCIESHFAKDLQEDVPPTMEHVPDVNKNSSVKRMLEAVKHLRAKCVLRPGFRLSVLTDDGLATASPEIWSLLGKQVGIMESLGCTLPKDSRECALMASTSVSWEKARELMERIDLKSSRGNAVFWLFLKVEEPSYWFWKPEGFEQFQLSYIMLLVDALKACWPSARNVFWHEQETFDALDIIYNRCNQLLSKLCSQNSRKSVNRYGYELLPNYNPKIKAE